MLAYIIRRLFMGLIVILLVTFLVFVVMRVLPGDPLLMYLSENDTSKLTALEINALEHQFGLDQPLIMQYFHWIGAVIQGDLGTSVYYKLSVGHLIGQRLPVTLYLGILSSLLGIIVGITSGVICALRRGTWIDTLVTLVANVGITTPSFWAAILLIYFFGLKLGWLPIFGYTSPFNNFWLSTRQLILPVFCMSIFMIASLARYTRSSMLEVIDQDYMRTAWAKGIGERLIIMRHGLKNALIPVITTAGVHISHLFGGAVLIETVFNIPGMGRLLTDAVFGRDFKVIQGEVLFIAMVVVVTNIVVDISYGWLDPRIRFG
jgi:peptide/nickel transport system permease protein